MSTHSHLYILAEPNMSLVCVVLHGTYEECVKSNGWVQTLQNNKDPRLQNNHHGQGHQHTS